MSKDAKRDDLDVIAAELDAHSSSLSASVRVIAFAMIAALWAISNATHLAIPSTFSNVGISIFLLSVLILFLDFLQHLSGYWAQSTIYDKRDKGTIKKLKYTRKKLGFWPWFGYRASFVFFVAKLVVAAGTSCLFLMLMAEIF